jgi:pimeloyl-ACP methyl ester carboxylesterase
MLSLDAVPLSANGKVDRKRLPAPELADAAADSVDEVEPPADDAEALVRDAMATLLGVQPASLCCRRAHFFRKGGDSLTALRLLLAVRKALDAPRLGVQQLFADPTIRGIAAAARPANDGSTAKEPSSQLRLVRLQEGEADRPPLVLVHPAGASSLCYLPLITRLGLRASVYAIDDAYLTGEYAAFGFRSIEAVADECLSLVASAIGASSLVLGGWSYGGVVALQMAARLAQAGAEAPHVHSVLMFDSPLGQTAGQGFHRGDDAMRGGALVQTLRAQLQPLVDDEAALDTLSANAASHFAACNELLDVYDAAAVRVGCPLVDVRPLNSECDFMESLAPLTKGPVHSLEVGGDHFTMLFGEHTAPLVDAVAPFLPEQVV